MRTSSHVSFCYAPLSPFNHKLQQDCMDTHRFPFPVHSCLPSASVIEYYPQGSRHL